jgi:hypothetical protein
MPSLIVVWINQHKWTLGVSPFSHNHVSKLNSCIISQKEQKEKRKEGKEGVLEEGRKEGKKEGRKEREKNLLTCDTQLCHILLIV